MLSLLEVEHCLGEGSIPDYQSQINSECQRDIIGSQTASAKIRSRKGNYETDGLSAANHDLDKLFLALQIAKNMRIEGR